MGSHSSIVPNIFQEHLPKEPLPQSNPTETNLSKSKFYNVQQDTSYIYFIARKLLEIDTSETTKIEVFKILFNQMLIRISKSKIGKSILKPMYALYRQLKHRIRAEITELPKSPWRLVELQTW